MSSAEALITSPQLKKWIKKHHETQLPGVKIENNGGIKKLMKISML